MLMTSKSAFAFPTPEDSLGFLLWKTTVTWQRQIKTTLEPFDLSHAQFVIIATTRWFFETKQEVTQVTIARHTGV